MVIDWFKYVKHVKVSNEKQAKKGLPKEIITLSSWERRETNIIDYFTNFSAN